MGVTNAVRSLATDVVAKIFRFLCMGTVVQLRGCIVCAACDLVTHVADTSVASHIADARHLQCLREKRLLCIRNHSIRALPSARNSNRTMHLWPPESAGNVKAGILASQYGIKTKVAVPGVIPLEQHRLEQSEEGLFPRLESVTVRRWAREVASCNLEQLIDREASEERVFQRPEPSI